VPKARPILAPCLPLIGLFLASTGFAQQDYDLSLLRALDQQTQSLYRQVSASVIRVQLPILPLANGSTTQPSNAMGQWMGRLDPELRVRLQQNPAFVAEVVPTTQPQLLVVRPNFTPPPNTKAGFIPNIIGLVIDAQGHAMLPAYLSPEYAANKPLPVLLSDGSVTLGHFIASDRKSHLTVIQVDHAGLRPAVLMGGRPADGALVMTMSVDPSQTHLSIWTRFADNWGLVARSDGGVAGFSGHGYFLSADACRTVVRQLIEYHQVRRRLLGVRIEAVSATDPQRLVDTALGQTPAIRIWQVIADSPAAKAKLRVGDLILTLAGEPVGDALSFAAAIAERRGSTPLTILRQDRIISITVDLKDQVGDDK
jgi:hypothetical protein